MTIQRVREMSQLEFNNLVAGLSEYTKPDWYYGIVDSLTDTLLKAKEDLSRTNSNYVHFNEDARVLIYNSPHLLYISLNGTLTSFGRLEPKETIAVVAGKIIGHLEAVNDSQEYLISSIADLKKATTMNDICKLYGVGTYSINYSLMSAIGDGGLLPSWHVDKSMEDLKESILEQARNKGMNKEEVINKILELVRHIDNFYPGQNSATSIMAMAGTSLVLQGFRDVTQDIDLNIDLEPMTLIEFFGWSKEEYKEVIRTSHYDNGVFDIYFVPITEDLNTFDNGIQRFGYQTLEGIYSFKIRANRDKDQMDIKILEEALGYTSNDQVKKEEPLEFTIEEIEPKVEAHSRRYQHLLSFPAVIIETFVLGGLIELTYDAKSERGTLVMDWQHVDKRSVVYAYTDIKNIRNVLANFITTCIDALLLDDTIILSDTGVEIFGKGFPGGQVINVNGSEMELTNCVTPHQVLDRYGDFLDSYTRQVKLFIDADKHKDIKYEQ